MNGNRPENLHRCDVCYANLLEGADIIGIRKPGPPPVYEVGPPRWLCINHAYPVDYGLVGDGASDHPHKCEACIVDLVEYAEQAEKAPVNVHGRLRWLCVNHAYPLVYGPSYLPQE